MSASEETETNMAPRAHKNPMLHTKQQTDGSVSWLGVDAYLTFLLGSRNGRDIVQRALLLLVWYDDGGGAPRILFSRKIFLQRTAELAFHVLPTINIFIS